MAVKKKSGGARKRKSTATVSTTKTFGGKKYTKSTCSATKTAAKKAADTARAGGKNARVVKQGTAYCVFTRTAGR